MHLELQQITYIEGTPTQENLEGYAKIDPGYGILHEYAGRDDIIITMAAISYGDVGNIDEAVVALRHHQMSLGRGTVKFSPHPFAATESGPSIDPDTGHMRENVMYLHDFSSEQVLAIQSRVG